MTLRLTLALSASDVPSPTMQAGPTFLFCLVCLGVRVVGLVGG
jgi:hypothetical protein